jgi:hypothetical protein
MWGTSRAQTVKRAFLDEREVFFGDSTPVTHGADVQALTCEMFASGKPMHNEVPPGNFFSTDSVGDQGGAVTFAICAQGLKAVGALFDLFT